jgi:hypothetical protein
MIKKLEERNRRDRNKERNERIIRRKANKSEINERCCHSFV